MATELNRKSILSSSNNRVLQDKHRKAGLYLKEEGELLHLVHNGDPEPVYTWLARNATYIDIWNQADWFVLKTQGVEATH